MIRDNSIGITDKLEIDTELAQHLAMLSIGDSCHFLKEFLPHWMTLPSKKLGGISQETSIWWGRHGSSLENLVISLCGHQHMFRMEDMAD